MIYVTENELEEIHKILKNFPYEVYVFGSRVKGNYRKFSDLDLIVTSDVSDVEKAELRELFEESNLPFEVDVISKNSISKEFWNKIEQDLVKIR